MEKIEESVEIERPVDQVFAYVINIKNLPIWEQTILEVEQTSPGQIGIGSTFQGITKVMGRRTAWTSKATEYELNKKYGETISSGSTQINLQWIFEPRGENTKFTVVHDIKMGGLLRIFAPMMTGSIRKQSRDNLNRLKHILEVQT